MKVTRQIPALRVFRLAPNFTQIFRDEVATVKVTFAWEETIFTSTFLASGLPAKIDLALIVLEAKLAAAACAAESTAGGGVVGSVVVVAAVGGAAVGGAAAEGGGVSAEGGVSAGGELL